MKNSTSASYFVCTDGTFAETPAHAAERELKIAFVNALVSTKDTFLAGAAERIADWLLSEREQIMSQYQQADKFVAGFPPVPMPLGAPALKRRPSMSEPKFQPPVQQPAQPAQPAAGDFDIEALDRELNQSTGK